MTANVPFGLLSEIMIAYVWNDALRASVVPVSDYMNKLKIPIIIFTIIMFVAGENGYIINLTPLELAASLNRALYLTPPTGFGAVNIITYFIIVVAISIFFVVTGVRLLRTFSKSKATDISSRRTKNLKRVKV